MNRNKTKKTRISAESLGIHIDYDSFLYILRKLYRVVLKAKKDNLNAKGLQRRIRLFEKQSNIPDYLSSMPVNELIEQLEDMQYLYPLWSREVTLPRFI